MLKKIILAASAVVLLGSVAHAADVARPAPTLVTAAPAESWTGFYAGTHIGGATGNATVHDTNGGVAPGPFGYHPSGVLGGLQAGYNWQIMPMWLVGIEADLGYLDASGHGLIPSSNPGQHQDLTTRGGFYAGIAGRAGFVLNANTLIYAKGGYVHYDTNSLQQTTFPGYVGTGTGARDGYQIGGGVEYALTSLWTMKAEYLRYEFGRAGGYQTNVGDLSSPKGYRFENVTDLTVDTFRVGFNRRFSF